MGLESWTIEGIKKLYIGGSNGPRGCTHKVNV